jgi:hypothetical protein
MRIRLLRNEAGTTKVPTGSRLPAQLAPVRASIPDASSNRSAARYGLARAAPLKPTSRLRISYFPQPHANSATAKQQTNRKMVIAALL